VILQSAPLNRIQRLGSQRLISGGSGENLSPMRRILRTAICYAFAILISVGRTAMTPDRVLCVGPGNHYHLETVVGASCNEPLPVSEGSAPRTRDGCPKGSKDLRLGVDTHRGKNPSVAGTFAPLLSVATGSVELFKILHDDLPRSPRAQQSPATTVILRC
jgi:hypothetical protein